MIRCPPEETFFTFYDDPYTVQLSPAYSWDNSGYPSVTIRIGNTIYQDPGAEVELSVPAFHNVYYTAKDPSNNMANCTMQVSVRG